MKIKNLILFVVLMWLMNSCTTDSPGSPYVYQSNPQYTWGYAQFYGTYYSNYQIENNVLSVSLFSKELSVDKNGALIGYGQYLILEDVFLAPTDTLLHAGTYKVSATHEPFTFFDGRKIKQGKIEIPTGAYINYIEADPTKNKVKLIIGGSFTVSIENDTVYSISCDFTTDDNRSLKGNFKGVLPHFDESAKTPVTNSLRFPRLN